MREPLVRINGLTIDFDTGQSIVRALHGFDLQIEKGEAVGIVGESGSGKSITWLGALGLLGPRARVSGDVQHEGRDILGLSEREMAAIRGKRIAVTT